MKRYLIVGLGNPGQKYARQRHNVGFMILDAISRKHNVIFTKHKSKSMIATLQLNNIHVILSKPQTFMNLSGQSVHKLMRYYDIQLDNLLVIFDDLDLSIGDIRIRKSGGSSGHKGMQSIISLLGKNTIPRLRLGIGRPPANIDPKDYVLRSFSDQQQQLINSLIPKVIEAVESFVIDGGNTSMSNYNYKSSKE
ncbi:MAG: aminoacyl-tRNA hydrolase [Anaerolineaceae bacterium]|nr:aminoacyl-tRNA hydrolase [Anaerolineaceae bacterium]